MATTSAQQAAAGEDRQLYQGLAGFRLAVRQFLSNSESLASAAGVTSQQYQAMLAIESHPDAAISMKALAEELLLLPHGAVQLVDRLQLMGMVRRQRATDDRRRVSISLTAKGRKTLRALAYRHLQELLTHEQLLIESLNRLRSLQDHATPDPAAPVSRTQ